MPFELTAGHFAILALAAFLVGGAKTGLSGIGILAVPLFAMVFTPFQSAGLLLPVLVVADGVAVAAWRRHGDQKMLWPLVPWVLAGVLAASGVLYLAAQPGSALAGINTHLSRILGVLILAMLALSMAKKGVEDWIRDHPHAAPATGLLAGVATSLNAAGPVMNLYLLAKRLPKEAFVGIGAWFFLVVNAIKILIVCPASGTFTLQNAWLALTLTPFVLAGCWAGFTLVKRLPERSFQPVVRLFILAAAVRMLCA